MNKEAVKFTHLLDIETSQAQEVVQPIKDSHTSVLSWGPRFDEDTVLTVFLADQFGKNVAKENDGGVNITTTIMAFQKIFLIILLMLNVKLASQKFGQEI